MAFRGDYIPEEPKTYAFNFPELDDKVVGSIVVRKHGFAKEKEYSFREVVSLSYPQAKTPIDVLNNLKSRYRSYKDCSEFKETFPDYPEEKIKEYLAEMEITRKAIGMFKGYCLGRVFENL